MVALAQRGDDHARRQAKAFVYDDAVVDAMFEKVPERFAGRSGGYCRIVPVPYPRRGDNAQMVKLQLLGDTEQEEARARGETVDDPTDADKMEA